MSRSEVSVPFTLPFIVDLMRKAPSRRTRKRSRAERSKGIVPWTVAKQSFSRHHVQPVESVAGQAVHDRVVDSGGGHDAAGEQVGQGPPGGGGDFPGLGL